MRTFGVRAVLSTAAFCVLSLLSPLSAYADSVTITVEGVGATSGNSDLSDYVYPYFFSINRSTSYTPMMCLSYLSDISVGETWQATIITPTTNLEKEAIYIYSLAAASGATQETIIDAQLADWYLFDTALTIPSEYADGVNALLTEAENFVATNTDPSFYSGYAIYDVVDGTSVDAEGKTVSDGQNLVTVAHAPEPSSLVLLGSGLSFAALFFYCQKRKSLRNISAGFLK